MIIICQIFQSKISSQRNVSFELEIFVFHAVFDLFSNLKGKSRFLLTLDVYGSWSENSYCVTAFTEPK